MENGTALNTSPVNEKDLDAAVRRLVASIDVLHDRVSYLESRAIDICGSPKCDECDNAAPKQMENCLSNVISDRAESIGHIANRIGKVLDRL